MIDDLFIKLVLVIGISTLYVSCASTPSESPGSPDSPDSADAVEEVSEEADVEEEGLVTIIEESATPVSEEEVETLDDFEDFDDPFIRAAEQSVISSYLGRNRESRIVIYFDFDSAFLALDGRTTLDRIIADIKDELALTNEILNIRVEGHTDERGSNEYNLALGQRRADSVTRYMILQGIAATQLESISYGETRPASSGSGEIAWQENRRVEINY